MAYRPYPDRERALRQLDRHLPSCVRDPHAYEPQILTVADWLAEQDASHLSHLIAPDADR